MGLPSVELETLDATFGAVVHGIDIRAIDDATAESIREVWVEFGLLIFPAQHLTRAEQDGFARRFGELEVTAVAMTNVRADGTVRSDPKDNLVMSLLGNEGWHHDSTFMPVQARGAVFSAEIIPSSGGATGFVDMRAAYEALDADTRRQVAGLSAYHSRRYSMARSGYMPNRNEAGGYDLYGFHDMEPPLRPLVKVHPDSGQPNLVAGQHAYGIVGMTDEESRAFLDQLNDAACAAPRTYHHQWSVGDAVLWDNIRLMHRATPYDPTEPRRMWHTRIAGGPSELATNYQPEA